MSLLDSHNSDFPSILSMPPIPSTNKKSDNIQVLDQRSHLLKRPDTFVGNTKPIIEEQWIAYFSLPNVPEIQEEKTIEEEMISAIVSESITEATKEMDETEEESDTTSQVSAQPSASISSLSTLSSLSLSTINPATKAKPIKPKLTLRLANGTFTEGFHNVLNELLVNAADNARRSSTTNQIMKYMEITVSDTEFTIKNDGNVIPIEIHTQTKLYAPQVVFSLFQSSENYNDDERRLTGGRNGIGAKACNVMSHSFKIEICDTVHLYQQTFEKNMAVIRPPIIKSTTLKNNYTKITVVPDLTQFGMSSITEFDIGMLRKRACDLAATTGVRVVFNKERIDIKNFKDYVPLFLSDKFFYCQPHERWQVAITTSPENKMRKTAFVNNICTVDGGEHVDYILEQVREFCKKKLEEQKKPPVHGKLLTKKLWLFVDAAIENPSFDTQNKRKLCSKPSSFGSSFQLPEAFLNNVWKTIVKPSLEEQNTTVKDAELGKLNTANKKINLRDIPNYLSAKYADVSVAKNKKEAHKCTLILMEGKSAMELVKQGLHGLSDEEQDYYGIFPLRGKVKNVRKKHTEVASEESNVELNYVVRIMNLQYGVKYDSLATLNYGSIMIMTDQDVDGSHIKALVMNFIHFHWPELVHMPGFLRGFTTPIVKATLGSRTESFYSQQHLDRWKEQHQNENESWSFKYYKGLGTSSNTEGREMFRDLPKHLIKYDCNEQGDEVIDMVMSERTDARKRWIESCDVNAHVEYETLPNMQLSIHDFVNKELIHFALYSIGRAIPQLVDGLKIVQRKILWTVLHREDKQIKVASLSGAVIEKAAYHHGEVSASNAITAMAKSYTGSNNLPLLMDIGQFGSRHNPDAASARYIFTKVSPISRFLFRKEDDGWLTHANDDGIMIEPVFFQPILPVILTNGVEGMAMCYSTKIPMYNPMDVVENVRRWIRKEELNPMMPWFDGFTGKVEMRGLQVVTTGIVTRVGNGQYLVTELPMHMIEDDYRSKLNKTMDVSAEEEKEKEEKKEKDDKENKEDKKKKKNDKNDRSGGSGGNKKKIARLGIRIEDATQRLPFLIQVSSAMDEKLQGMSPEQLVNAFDLTGVYSITSNMTVIDQDQHLQTYTNPLDILRDFCKFRKPGYETRKQHRLNELRIGVRKAQEKSRFIQEVLDKTIVLEKKKRVEIVDQLMARGFEKESNSYDYLMDMKLWSMSVENMEKLEVEVAEKKEEMERYEKIPAEDLWLADLDEFVPAYHKRRAEILKERDMTEDEKNGNGKRGREKEKEKGRGKKRQKIGE